MYGDTENLSTLIGIRDVDISTSHETLVAKIVAMVVLFFATIICGVIPLVLNICFKWTQAKPNSRSAAVIDFLLYLSGGVLFATTFLHVLVEVHEVVDHLSVCGEIPQLPFSLPETLMSCGFFLIYLIEAFVHIAINKHTKKVEKQQRKQCFIESTINISTKVDVDDTVDSSNLPKCCEEPIDSDKKLSLESDTESMPKSFPALLIVTALSLHEIFEGLAIGLESHARSVWIMFAAVAAHKLVLAFCLGVEITVSRMARFLSAVYILLFSVITPIGIGVGIALSHNGMVTTSSLTSAILQGLASGTLLYVVFFEILKKCQVNLKSLVAIFLGFAIMFGLQMLNDGDGPESC